MNKLLLIWNMVISVALVLTVISGCATLDPEYASTAAQVKNNRIIIDQLVTLSEQNSAKINENNTAILKNTLSIASLQTSTRATIAATEASLRQLIQTYVSAR